ncbi:MAG TPA: translation elongation factor Ts [Frankiaceae bacterium]|nr:translation elongation factor Ts [Frankiaceae bacterium]
MPEVTATLIKKVREITGAGMSDVKKALVEAAGEVEVAVEELRKKGVAKMVKRGAERTTSNGLIAAAEGAMIELACETDFVAKNEQFQGLAADIVAHAAKTRTGEVPALLAEQLADGKTVQENIEGMQALLGEKIELRRVAVLDGQVASYMHRRASDLPPQIGVLLEFEGPDESAARGAAMQVSAMRAQYLSRDEVPSDLVENERRIAEATAREEGKPEQALSRIVEGRVNGFYKDVVLLEQPSVQPDAGKKTVQQVLDGAGVTVKRFARFEVGSA